MVKRSGNAGENEPDQKTFSLPSEREHLLQVVDFIDQDDPNVVQMKIEVVGGEENGRSMLHRLTLDFDAKGFFATRLFLKAIGEPYKGAIDLDTDFWIGRQFYAEVVHNIGNNKKVFANIATYNFDKQVEHPHASTTAARDNPIKPTDQVAWDD